MITCRAVLSMLVLFSIPDNCFSQGLGGSWDGSIVMRGESWPIELNFENGDPKLAHLSIPSMGMIDNPIRLEKSSRNKTSISLPFGLGDFELDPDGDLLVSHRKLANGRRITLLVEKVPNNVRPYLQNEVSIPNGNVTLKGTTYIPRNAKSPSPGVVILHGSGPSGRTSWEYRSWADFFARRGIATLIYDKRPFKEEYPDLQLLAADAKAAIDYFQAHPKTQAQSIGFFGGSQAAWLASEVASRADSNVAFIVMSGWPAVSPIEQERQSIESRLDAANLANDEFNRASAYLRLYCYVASTPKAWHVLESASKVAAKENWAKLVPIPKEKSDLNWWRRNADFPTRQHLSNVKCPVLACYGAKDSVVPPNRNSQRLMDVLTESGNDDVTIAIFENADHRIELPMVMDKNHVRWPQLSPNYLQKIESWLEKRFN